MKILNFSNKGNFGLAPSLTFMSCISVELVLETSNQSSMNNVP